MQRQHQQAAIGLGKRQIARDRAGIGLQRAGGKAHALADPGRARCGEQQGKVGMQRFGTEMDIRIRAPAPVDEAAGGFRPEILTETIEQRRLAGRQQRDDVTTGERGEIGYDGVFAGARLDRHEAAAVAEQRGAAGNAPGKLGIGDGSVAGKDERRPLAPRLEFPDEGQRHSLHALNGTADRGRIGTRLV